MERNTHEHEWVYDHSGCCYALKCRVPGCERWTTVNFFVGERPAPGDRVQILNDGKTMQRI